MRGTVAKRLRRLAYEIYVRDRKVEYKRVYKDLKAEYKRKG